MPISLSKEHRKLLENTTAQARVLAETASKAALENLAVHEKEYRAHMSDEQRGLRNRLRSRARALGDARDAKGEQSIRHLTELAAYEHWHRLLFTRFLTENHLLITDEENGSVPITLDECEELAPELGARDGFDLACRFAGRILPGVFRRDDPVLELPIALNDQVAMRNLLNSLPTECFQADDALGWTYQFWQAQRKEEVNKSGKKIGADDLSPVTQLFTEDYMVEFLLHNTLGAWWAGKLGPIQAASEEEARARASLSARDGVPAIVWSYLRFVQDETTKTWLPAAGTFDGWPITAKLIRLLDPSMGSGHFLVFALPLLVRLRMEQEQLAPKASVVAVLNDNIHGLELDERCTQIAAFNVALTAWKLAGYQSLPQLHLACSGLAPRISEKDWLAFAGNDDRILRSMKRLFDLFKDAPLLGSLINPRSLGGGLIEAEFHDLAPSLRAAFLNDTKLRPTLESDSSELGVIAQGIAKAAELLASQFTLVITNVPYLGRGNQDEVLQDYCERVHNEAKADLATCFVERCLSFCADKSGSTALVSPQNWLFLGSYKHLRRKFLADVTWNLVTRLGTNAFETISGEVVNVALKVLTRHRPGEGADIKSIDASGLPTPSQKAIALLTKSIASATQLGQYRNPDWRITLVENSKVTPLGTFAIPTEGLSTGDRDRFVISFWEIARKSPNWECLQTGTEQTSKLSGFSEFLRWDLGRGDLQKAEGARIQGDFAWGKPGVLIARVSSLRGSDYGTSFFDKSCVVLTPRRMEQLSAISAFAKSPEFEEAVRVLDKKTYVTTSTFSQIPFDLAYWQEMAEEKYPNGMPKPFSSDPTQWLFNGHLEGADQSLHVAVARLLGYAWPRQTGSSFPDSPALGPDGLEGFAKCDGIVCLPPVNHEQPAANRLRLLLAAALGSFDESSLIAAAGPKGSKSKTLEDWLRDEFFEQHTKLFQDRPFIWHLWDGRPDGFHVLVNYHKLDHATLQKLTYSYLGDWIQDQARDAKDDKPGAAERLGAAQELQKKLSAILEGEAPLDIFVRWKPLKDQAEGWHPDLNDGVRQNIRPFLLVGDVGKRGAGLFRAVPLKLKESDRGNEPQRPKEDYPWFWCEDEPGTDPAGGDAFVGTRWNNVHLTLAKKKGAKA